MAKRVKNEEKIPEWYRLDNAGKIFPAIISRRMTSLFRLSATLKTPINITFLQEALNEMMKRCPYFNVRLKKGLFWYFFEKNNTLPTLFPDSKQPCMNYNIKKYRKHLFRVIPYQNRIAVEFSHGLTDGTGALLFLKSLVAIYLEKCGIHSDEKTGLLNPSDPPDPAEIEDGFKLHYNKEIPSPTAAGKAFHLPGKLDQPGHYRVTIGVIPVKIVLEKAREHKSSLTEYMAAMLIDSYQDYYKTLSPKLMKKLAAPIVLRIPVNLRQMFPSKSMLNFFLAVSASVDPRLGHYPFNEILNHIKATMTTGVDPKHISQQIARNVRGELSWGTKLFPLVIKDLILKIVYKKMGDNRISCSLSNLGKITMPAAYASEIVRFDFIPPPTLLNRINCSLLSWNDKLYFSFGNLGIEPAIEEIFFRKLVKSGIPVKIESNNQEFVCPIVQDVE